VDDRLCFSAGGDLRLGLARDFHPRVEAPRELATDDRVMANSRRDTTGDAVTVRDLCKSYDGRTVVDHLNLDVPAGQIFGLIGANGAGKTTTVECLQGLRNPDAGSIRVLGLDPLLDAQRLRGLVGSQLQQSGLPDRMRVAEAVELFGRPGRAARRAGGELLERFGLGPRRKAAFATLSGGEQQRLFLVLALLNQPRLVILDELTQGLDPAARRTVWEAIAALRCDGATVLLVTHELQEAQELCDQVVAMRCGKVLARGAPNDLIDRYAPWASVSFSVGRAEDAARLTVLGGRVPGVRKIVEYPGRVSVFGDRMMIAHLGAAFVEAGQVPADLRVHMPTLEDALLKLLETDEPSEASKTESAPTSQVPASNEMTGVLS
jgi:ABC-2 type transport system ATP-binding protein